MRKMKILYGLSGDGFGHSSRARSIIPYLEKKGHKLKILTYGRAVKILKKQGFDVLEIYGMEMKFKQAKLDKTSTTKESLKSFLTNIKKSKKIHSLMKESFDLCISDMEPLVPILSFWYRLPLLSIDNQHRLVNLELKIPKKYLRDYRIAKFVTESFVARADWYIITSFTKSKIKKKYQGKTYIVPPIIRPEVKKLKAKKKNKILVYLTRKNARLLNILKNFNEEFVIYGYDVEKKQNNLIFHKSGDKFLRDLAECKAIIATAGFTLISESLYLKKPYFALPLEGQFEQVLNALFLKNAKLGDYSEKPEKEKISDFLANLKKYDERLKKYSPDYDLLFKTLDKVLKKVKKI